MNENEKGLSFPSSSRQVKKENILKTDQEGKHPLALFNLNFMLCVISTPELCLLRCALWRMWLNDEFLWRLFCLNQLTACLFPPLALCLDWHLRPIVVLHMSRAVSKSETLVIANLGLLCTSPRLCSKLVPNAAASQSSAKQPQQAGGTP